MEIFEGARRYGHLFTGIELQTTSRRVLRRDLVNLWRSYLLMTTGPNSPYSRNGQPEASRSPV